MLKKYKKKLQKNQQTNNQPVRTRKKQWNKNKITITEKEEKKNTFLEWMIGVGGGEGGKGRGGGVVVLEGRRRGKGKERLWEARESEVWEMKRQNRGKRRKK